MYRLLVVDDEEIITDALYETFAPLMPERLDVYRAYSSQEALSWMARTRIDIVLTDIQMPGMNGLEMSQQIQKTWPRCRILFLTGHNSFDYAYQAFQLQNVKYLLKTEGYDKIVAAVLKILDELDENNQMLAVLEQSNEQLEVLGWMEQGSYLRQLLLYNDESQQLSTANLSKEFQQIALPFFATEPVVMALGRIFYTTDMPYETKNKVIQTIRRIWKSFLSDKMNDVLVVDNYGDLLWFLQPQLRTREKEDKQLILYLEGMIELIQETCLQTLGIALTFTISGASCKWSEAPHQYARLRQLQQLKVGDGVSMILKDVTDELDSSFKEETTVVSKPDALEAHLEAGREQEFMDELDHIITVLRQNTESVQPFIETYYSIALILLSNLNRLGPQGKKAIQDKLMRLDDHASMKEAFDYLREIAKALFDYRQLEPGDRTTQIIERICLYIEEHLGEDVSLVHLAEVHYFNPSYLSRLFKQERGMNLSEYIERCRIRKAKELLHNGELKIRDIALLVGYDAAHSFTRFFKKKIGMTPQEYRDHVFFDRH